MVYARRRPNLTLKNLPIAIKNAQDQRWNIIMILIKTNVHKYTLYIRNLIYCTFNTIFRQHNIHLVFSTCQHKYKWTLCTEKQVLTPIFKDFWCTNINIHLICFDKYNKFLFKRLKIHYTQHEFLALNTYLSSFSKKSDAKI